MPEKQPQHHPEKLHPYYRLLQAAIILLLLTSCANGEARPAATVFSQEALQTLATLPPDYTLIDPTPIIQPETDISNLHQPPAITVTITNPDLSQPDPTPLFTPAILAPEPPAPAIESTLNYTEQLQADLTQFPGLDFSQENKAITFMFDLPNSRESETTFTVFPFVRNGDIDLKTYLAKTSPGLKSAGIVVDSYGNIQVEIHSGQKGNQNLEAESLRQLIEGVGVSDNLTDEQARSLQQKLNNLLVGSIAKISQIPGNQKPYVIENVAYIPHHRLGGDDTLDVIRDLYPLLDRNGNILTDEYGQPLSKFDIYIQPGKQAIMPFFCGRTTNRTGHPSDWYTWSRYVVFVRPFEPTTQTRHLSPNLE